MRILHGMGSYYFADNLHKKFCQKHFDYWNKLGWLSPSDEIEIVPESKCESHMHNSERNKEKVYFD